ncbi:MAG: hypothetical protein RR198_05790 [Oscillospiraceae bacterium]
MNEFFTVEFLGTFTGMVAFVTLVTQVVKYYVNLDPKWISLAAAFVGQMVVQLVFLKDFSAQGVVMALFNVLAVVAASVGTFETVVKPVQRKLEQKK